MIISVLYCKLKIISAILIVLTRHINMCSVIIIIPEVASKICYYIFMFTVLHHQDFLLDDTKIISYNRQVFCYSQDYLAGFVQLQITKSIFNTCEWMTNEQINLWINERCLMTINVIIAWQKCSPKRNIKCMYNMVPVITWRQIQCTK